MEYARVRRRAAPPPRSIPVRARKSPKGPSARRRRWPVLAGLLRAISRSPRRCRGLECTDDRAGAGSRARDRVTFHLADAREFPFEESYDLAVAHFFFDCFEQNELAEFLAKVSAKNWLVSEFRNTRWSCPAFRGLYFFFRVTTGLQVKSLPNHRSILEGLGYRIEKEQTALAGLLVSELGARLAHVDPMKKAAERDENPSREKRGLPTLSQGAHRTPRSAQPCRAAWTERAVPAFRPAAGTAKSQPDRLRSTAAYPAPEY